MGIVVQIFCNVPYLECSLELSAYIATPFHELQFNYKRLRRAPLFSYISLVSKCIQALWHFQSDDGI
jgi:hypothetical protein